MAVSWTVLAVCAVLTVGRNVAGAPYLGKFIGKLSELHHGVSGEVYAVDGRTLYIKDFTYDGQGPAAYFYASVHKATDKKGFRLKDENNNGEVIRRYRKEGVTLTLPEGRNLNNIKIFYVYCEDYDVNFGDVKIPRPFDYPKPLKLAPLRGIHGISSDNVVIVDAQTLLVPNLSYDGEAPDAKFWVGRGPKPSPQGLRVPDENGKEVPLRRYDRKTVVLTLPGDLTVFDIGHFGIWCEAFTVDFGHVQIPQELNIPPSLKMLGVSPQSKLNCEVLYDDLAFEVRWAIAGESIVLQLVAKLEGREYMSFGPSGEENKSVMIGGDVVVAWVDKETLKGYAEDYYLEDKAQCSGRKGSCPDTKLLENTNNVRLLNAAMVNGYSIVTLQRPLRASDPYDLPIYSNRSQAIVWAIGPLNQRDEVSFHSSYLKKDRFIDFGRPAKWNCPMPEGEQPAMVTNRVRSQEEEIQTTTQRARGGNGGRRRGGNNRRQQEEAGGDSEDSATRTKEQTQQRRKTAQRTQGRQVATPAPVKKRDAWEIPPIQCYEPEDGVFYAQMGPTGGKRGYPAITGHVGWGISWYINGLLIPEVNVVRGKTYTFVVEGGSDPEVSAKYHPFYITDDPIGGYEYKTEEEKKAVSIFAGVTKLKDGPLVPVGTGRLCHWTAKGEKEADDFESFGAYQRTLELKCDQGEPGVIQWTPDKDTPDTVYYQCFTHRYLGWKINVHDSCDEQASGSELEPSILEPPEGFLDKSDVDLEESPSIRVETRVKLNDIVTGESDDDDSNPEISGIVVGDDYPLYRPPETTTTTTAQSPIITDNIAVSSVAAGDDYRTPPIRKPAPNFHQHLRPRVPIKMVVRYPNYPQRPKKRFPMRYYKPMMLPFKPPVPATKPPQEVIHVEISPQQASTEKEPEIQTAPTILRPAYNTGFKPSSIKIETGFTPIITKTFEDRMDQDQDPDIEIKYEGETGVIDKKPLRIFEPVFVPSPIDKPIKEKSYHRKPLTGKKPLHYTKIVLKHQRSLNDTDELIAEAAERADYYLPPRGERPIDVIREPSNIDIGAPPNVDSPPDTVVTFDGKKVSGQSLTAKISDRPTVSDQKYSKAVAYIKAGPQLGKYHGELPPLDLDSLYSAVLNKVAVLNRDLDTPPVGDENDRIKLRRVGSRRKRSAHHTPEHTALQEEEKMKNQKSGAGSVTHVRFSLIVAIWFVLRM